jgi:uncharacterized membrane protein
MNRALWIIAVPAVLVILGYLVVLREIGVAPAYGRLAAATAAFACGIWWLGRRNKKKV